MSRTVRPHGGRLVNRVLRSDRAKIRREEARELPEVRLDAAGVQDALNVASGAYSPLEGFMGRDDYERVLGESRLESGVPWTMPIVLDVPDRPDFAAGDTAALTGPDGRVVATIAVDDVYAWDRAEHARRVFGTTDPRHPGVAHVERRGAFLVGGRLELVDDARGPFADAALTPRETRVLFDELGWRTVAGYQTRNPPHRAHEHLQKTVLGLVDGLLIQPVVGPKKRGDFTDDVVLDAYRALVDAYFPRQSVALSVLRYAMRYAGPNEAIHHAIVRKNFGCSHFVVGRDHAGVGDYYDADAAIRRFDDFPDLGVLPIAIRGDHFWCRACMDLESERTCPHEDAARVRVSGTLIRKLLKEGGDAPPEILRPEVLAVMRKHDAPFVGD